MAGSNSFGMLAANSAAKIVLRPSFAFLLIYLFFHNCVFLLEWPVVR